MHKNIKILFILYSAILLTFSYSVYASDPFEEPVGGFKPLDTNDCSSAGVNCYEDDDAGELGYIILTIVEGALILVGIVAVVVIVIGGVLYITSIGDSNKVEKAKNTIIYAVVGLIVAALALAIVNFVGGLIRGGSGGSNSNGSGGNNGGDGDNTKGTYMYPVNNARISVKEVTLHE